QFFFQQPRCVIGLIGFERVTADNLRQSIGFVSGSSAYRPHFIKPDLDALAGDLPGGFAPGQSTADHRNQFIHCLKIVPFFVTNRTLCNTERSFVGSPSTATTSARSPSLTRPMRSSIWRTFAFTDVAAFNASVFDIPKSASISISRASSP